MDCPRCGKKTIFDWERCPQCGADPWTKPGEVLAAAPAGPRASGWGGRAKRLIRFYAARPALPRLFLVVGSAQAAYLLIANTGSLLWRAVHGQYPTSIFDWSYDVIVAATPGLWLIAIGEALAQLGRIAEGLRKG